MKNTLSSGIMPVTKAALALLVAASSLASLLAASAGDDQSATRTSGSAPDASDARESGSPILLAPVLVAEQGVSRANNILRPADIAATTKGGTNPLITLNRLPGVNVNVVDPLGIKTYSGTDLRLRAFGIGALAVAVDGIPTPFLGNYMAGNAPNQYIDAENFASSEVSPGTADLATPAYSALGGSINFHSRPPAEKPGVTLSGTYGSENLRRIFFRADTGKHELNPNHALSAFVSGSNSEIDEVFSTVGGYERQKYDVQVRWDAPNLSVTAAYGHFFADDLDGRPIAGIYQQHLGKNRTELAALGILGDLTDGGRNWFYSPVLDGDPNGLDSIYWNKNRNSRTTDILSARFEARPSGNLKIEAIPYYQERTGFNRGAVPFRTALQFYAENQHITRLRTGAYRTDISAPATRGTLLDDAWLAGYSAAVAAGTQAAWLAAVTDGTDQARQGHADGERYGIPIHLAWNLDDHKIETGIWLERDTPKYVRRGYNQINGSNANPYDYSSWWVVYYDHHFDIKTFQPYIKDTVRLIDERLTLSGGVRALYQKVDYKGQPDITALYNGVAYDKTWTFDDWFQPQLGATWKLNATDELFTNLSRNYSSIGVDIIGNTGVLENETSLKPEESINLDFGWRTTRREWSASLAGYLIRYRNRIGSINAYDPLGFGSASTRTNYANLGDVSGYGAEFAFAWAPDPDFRLGLSLTWQQLEYQDDYDEPVAGGGSVTRPISGNTVTNTPEWIINADATWFVAGTPWFAGVNARHQDGVFLTTSNSQSISGYTLFGLGIGYDALARPGAKGVLVPNLRVALNIDNLFDRHWFYSTGGSSYSGGSFYVGTPRSVSLSVSARF
ncbi:MAG: TonB-dependent receptor [Opitutaceae bacterium]|jgi:iron complex outermembrane receptor protein|nr:TonB-dependent receptor [Opitutaceae bacterium]